MRSSRAQLHPRTLHEARSLSALFAHPKPERGLGTWYMTVNIW